MARRLRNRRSRKLRGGSLFPLRPANFVGEAPAPEAPAPEAPAPKQSGGNSYVQNVAGTADQQYDRVFSQQGPYGNIPGNSLIGAQGQGVIPASQMPTAQQLAMAQSAGSRKRRGGFLGPMINQAAAPLALLALQQNYRPKSRMHSRKFSRRHRKSRR